MSYANMFGTQTVTDVAVKNDVQFATPEGFGTIFPAETKTNQLAVLKPSVQSKLTEARRVKKSMEVAEYGTKAGKAVADLADTVLKKTTTGKMAEFGDGITQILQLTETVDPKDLNIEKGKGLIGGLIGAFKKSRVQVMAKFEDTSKSVEKVATGLIARQEEMKKDNEFLDQMYEANMVEYHDLGDSVEAITANLVELNAEYEVMKAAANASQDQFQIQAVNEHEQTIKHWEKQADRLKRMQQVALLTAPEIRLIQTGNVTMVEKFSDLVHTTLPAWKKQMSLTALALKQKENAALGNAIDDKTNQFFRKAAELNNQNAIATAKSGERSVVEIDTLEFMQTQMIDAVKQVKSIQEQGREDRKNASAKIDELRDQMKTEMLSWSK